MVRYVYDSWGKVLSVTGSMAGTLGKWNPIRYRGYYYDVETGMYYLRSRYYNPMVGRFISIDSLVFVQNNNCANIASYCKNNPINYCDSSGYSPESAASWGSMMWWLMTLDEPLPIGDAIYWLGFAFFAIAGTNDAANRSTISIGQAVSISGVLSESINWLEANPNHILKGSRNHEPHDWSSFGIGPNDPNGWEKLLPILKKVVDTGFEMERNRANNGNLIYDCRDYINEKVTVIVKLFINSNGTLDVSDAWTVPLE